MDMLKIEAAQLALCNQYGARSVSTPPTDKVGFAKTTAGLKPIHGLRHPQTAGTSGWYIWCGESYSESDDFFEPQHASHLYESLAQVSHLFGLPPGYRFLLAEDYLDVWYDESLLVV